MTQPQAQQMDEERMAATRDMIRESELGTVFAIGFRDHPTALWVLVKNDRYEVTIVNLESGNVVTNKISMFGTMMGRRDDEMTMERWG